MWTSRYNSRHQGRFVSMICKIAWVKAHFFIIFYVYFPKYLWSVRACYKQMLCRTAVTQCAPSSLDVSDSDAW